MWARLCSLRDAHCHSRPLFILGALSLWRLHGKLWVKLHTLQLPVSLTRAVLNYNHSQIQAVQLGLHSWPSPESSVMPSLLATVDVLPLLVPSAHNLVLLSYRFYPMIIGVTPCIAPELPVVWWRIPPSAMVDKKQKIDASFKMAKSMMSS